MSLSPYAIAMLMFSWIAVSLAHWGQCLVFVANFYLSWKRSSSSFSLFRLNAAFSPPRARCKKRNKLRYNFYVYIALKHCWNCKRSFWLNKIALRRLHFHISSMYSELFNFIKNYCYFNFGKMSKKQATKQTNKQTHKQQQQQQQQKNEKKSNKKNKQ